MANWIRHGGCAQPDVDPEMWTVGSGTAGQNDIAINACFECPVRIPCRDAMFDLARNGAAPYGMIVAGWRWPVHPNGDVIPYPGDPQPKLPAVQVGAQHGGRLRIDCSDGRLFAAARALIDGATIAQAMAQAGTSSSSALQQAVLVIRHASHLIAEVEAGRATLGAATQVARVAARHKRTRSGSIPTAVA